MIILESQPWNEYGLLDSGGGKRLERFGKYILSRPDPQAIWKPHLPPASWEKVDAQFDGKWNIKTSLPEKWLMHYQDISFWARLTPFKHTGVFPEQTSQWEWIKAKINSATSELNIINLFAYTGIASLIAAKAGAKVTHVDASKPAITWAKENQLASHLSDKPIRWILDDCVKFLQREVKRGVKYNGIIMDPPVYGHGPSGGSWDFNRDFGLLLSLCRQVLSSSPVFILINAYAISASSLMLENVIADLKLPGKIEAGELALKEENGHRLLSTGIFGRWSA